MSDELIICVAPVPGETQEEKFPGELDVVEELARCHDAGAAIGHLHVRDQQHAQSVDTALFSRQLAALGKRCPLIIEASTGGAPHHTLEQRSVSFAVRGVEMGSLNMGSINMFGGVYRNGIEDIRFYARKLSEHGILPNLVCFDLSHVRAVERVADEGWIRAPFVYQFVFDVPDGLAYRPGYLDFFVNEVPHDGHWFLARHHAQGATAMVQALETGGHVRVGFEDGPFLSDGSRADGNAALVEDVVRAAEDVGRRVVSPDRARELLGLPSRTEDR